MFHLTEEAIDNGIDTISGYIVALVASETGRPLKEISEAFLSSDTFALLSDKETGYYWDSLSELIEKFSQEIESKQNSSSMHY